MYAAASHLYEANSILAAHTSWAWPHLQQQRYCSIHPPSRMRPCPSPRSKTAMTRPCGLLRVLHLAVLGLTSGWRKPQAFRVSAQAFVGMPVGAASNLDRFSQVVQNLEDNHFAASVHARPRSQLIKLRPSMLGQDSAGQPTAKPCGERHIQRVPCLGIAGPAPWKSQRISSCAEVAQDLRERRERGGLGGLSRRASAGSSDRHRLNSIAEESAPPGADEDGLMVDSGDRDTAPEGEKGKNNSNSWIKNRWEYALAKIKKEPFQILTIPLSAAFVGWITNKLAVEMIFHPLTWRGIPLRVIEGQPFGLIGWQGIVPAKTGVMSERLVDMVTTQLVDVEEVFRRLSPGKVARLLGPEVNTIVQSVFEDLSPRPLAWLPGGFGCRLPSQAVDELKGLRRSMLVGLTKDMQEHVHKVLDLKDMVVGEMLRDRSLMVSLFQQCGKAEFEFLVNSGFFFGFLLGVLQMFVWLVYDKPWILPAGGAVVGYLTNWLAIKLIFEPVDPIKLGPFVLQGLFLKRQNEVAADFAEFFSNNVLTSQKLWRTLLDGSRAEAFRELVTGRVVPFVSRASAVSGANLDPLTVKSLAARAADKLRNHVHVLHDYTDKTLALQKTMTTQMQKMSTRTFEGVLHPVFQEEEFILIVAGAILGTIAGFLQMLLSTKSVREAAKIAATKAAETATAAAEEVAGVGGELVNGVVDNAPAQVAQAAKKTVVGWRQRVAHSAKRCTSPVLEVAWMALISLSTAPRAAAVAIAGGWRRCLRSYRRGSNSTSVVSEAPDSDPPDPETCDPAPSASGES